MQTQRDFMKGKDNMNMEKTSGGIGGGEFQAQSQSQRLGVGDRKLKDIIGTDKRRLVEVPYTASLADTMNALMANGVVAVPVAAPPGHWIGAGGSMIMETDKQTGAVRKHYIGMVTMLDVVAHIAGSEEGDSAGGGGGQDFEKRMSVPVSSIIGHCLESLSLWTLNPNTSIIDCMEVFSKGIHRAMVPIDSQVDNVAGVELVDSASSYRMFTQMDLLRYLRSHESELKGILTRTVKEAGAISDIIFGITDQTKVIDAIKCMRTTSLAAVPIVESSSVDDEDHRQLVNGKERKLVGTFSASDLKRLPIFQLQTCLQMGVVEFLEKLAETAVHEASGLRGSVRDPITCHAESPVGEAIDKAVTYHVHRVWVVDHRGFLQGLVSLTDFVRVVRVWLLTEPVYST